MKLAISNLAWAPEEDRAVAALMRAHGFAAVELAPTKYWSRPLEASRAQVRGVRKFWEEEGLPIVALQSLLFGTAGLALFGEAAARRAMGDHLAGIIGLGGALGAKTLVFGSPRNRLRGALSPRDAEAIAVPFFRELGRIAGDAGTRLCIEANPPQYGCDWITDSAHARALVAAVDSPGFGLHLDAAGMTLAGEDLPSAIAAAAGTIRHFHASEPDLAPLAPGGAVDHAAAVRALAAAGYGNFVSIEMRPVAGAAAAEFLPPALVRVAMLYGGNP